MTVSEINIGLDSQCYTYLISALNDVVEPKDDDPTKEQKISLVRLFLYPESITFCLSPTVINEYEEIRDSTRLDIHNSWASVHFCKFNPEPLIDHVNVLKDCLLEKHNKENDCKIISEYKLYGVNTVLSYDSDLLKKLSGLQEISSLKILSPLDFWSSLNVAEDSNPSHTPTGDNPLSNQTWWRW